MAREFLAISSRHRHVALDCSWSIVPFSVIKSKSNLATLLAGILLLIGVLLVIVWVVSLL